MNHITDINQISPLLLGAALFCIGLFGVCTRRNIIIMLLSVELMLTGVNTTFVSFSTINNSLDGQLAVFFVVTVAAAEGAIGLGLLISIFRNLKEVGTSSLSLMKD